MRFTIVLAVPILYTALWPSTAKLPAAESHSRQELSAVSLGFQSANTDVAACAPKLKGIKVIEHKNRPIPSPPPGKALVCVMRIGGRIPLKPPAISISANNRWVGEVRKQTYFCFESDPGLVTLCAKLQGSLRTANPDILALTVLPEHTYYVQSEWAGGGPTRIQQIEPAGEAGMKQGVKKIQLKYLTFEGQQ